MGTCVLLKILLVEAEESEEDVKLPIESIGTERGETTITDPVFAEQHGTLSEIVLVEGEEGEEGRRMSYFKSNL